jgi:SEC-C motif-containing protein
MNRPCPCGSNKQYIDCCGRYLDGNEMPTTAEALMRSRYTAYTLQREDYLLATWHTSTRPTTLNLSSDNATNWVRLEVKKHKQNDIHHAIVEFVAYYKINGRMHKLHEISQFVRVDSRWFYLSDIIK